jgi:hypothetical protein
MDLKIIWELFFGHIVHDARIGSIEKKMIAGIPFVYVKATADQSKESVTQALKENAVKAMKGKRLTLELIFVRSDDNIFIYRMRFHVPQEKMFCCGNLCFDCIRLRNL